MYNAPANVHVEWCRRKRDCIGRIEGETSLTDAWRRDKTEEYTQHSCDHSSLLHM